MQRSPKIHPHWLPPPSASDEGLVCDERVLSPMTMTPSDNNKEANVDSIADASADLIDVDGI